MFSLAISIKVDAIQKKVHIVIKFHGWKQRLDI